MAWAKLLEVNPPRWTWRWLRTRTAGELVELALLCLFIVLVVLMAGTVRAALG